MPAPFTHLSLGYRTNIATTNQTLNPVTQDMHASKKIHDDPAPIWSPTESDQMVKVGPQ
jgi:hypothetical protein